MAENPKIQQRVYDEISAEIGVDRLPNLHDRSQTPFTMAVIDEVLRHCPMVTLNVPHMTIEDIKLNGLFIPKYTAVYTMASTVHRDPKVNVSEKKSRNSFHL